MKNKRINLLLLLAVLFALPLIFPFGSTKALAAEDGYLTFSSTDSFKLKSAKDKTWDGTLFYCTSDPSNASNWSTWDGSEIVSGLVSSDYVIYLRGTGNTYITNSNNQNKKWTLTGSDSNFTFSCTGNIENLLDYSEVTSGNHPTMAPYCFAELFSGCTSLVAAPTLGADTLVDHCYYKMFYGCSKLTTPPTINATTCAESCCDSMFSNCTSLVTPPTLSATTLAKKCYYQMFSGCSKLASAPQLNVMDLAESCYNAMFYGCTSLTTAPSLPATTLTESCYNGMFRNTGLTSAPELNADTLAPSCYYNMFAYCKEFNTAPSLPALTMQKQCYGYMFSNCTNLENPPALPATTLADSCYIDMFQNCVKLQTAPVLAAQTLQKGCYQSMFSSCTSLATAPTLPAETLAESCYETMFSNCKALVTAPALPAETLAKNCYKGMFSNCKALVTAPELPATVLAPACYQFMFYNCTILVTVPDLAATTLASNCCSNMFQGCTSLVTAPALPATELAACCYYNMFQGCTSLVNVPVLPATKMENSCYYAMFYGCLKLVTPPDLPATELAANCYYNMFYQCSALTTVPDLPATTLVNNCYNSMFGGCYNIILKATPEEKYRKPWNVPETIDSAYASGMFSTIASVPFKPSPIPVGGTTYYRYAETVKLTFHLTNLSPKASLSVIHTENGIEETIEVLEGYLLPDSITVSAGGVALTEGEDGYTYDKTTGLITIPSKNCICDIEITAVGVPKKATGPATPSVLGSYTESTTEGKFMYTLTASLDGQADLVFEYRMDEQAWQDSNVFDGIDLNATHTFSARVKETADTEAGAICTTEQITFVKLAQNLAFASSDIKVTLGNEAVSMQATGAVSGSTITYSSSEPDVAAVDAQTGQLTVKAVGTTTITATATGTATYTDGSASYTLTVIAAPTEPSTPAPTPSYTPSYLTEDMPDYMPETTKDEKTDDVEKEEEKEVEPSITFVNPTLNLLLGTKETFELKVVGYDVEKITWHTTRKNRAVVSANNGSLTAVVNAKTLGTDTLFIRVDGVEVASIRVVVVDKRAFFVNPPKNLTLGDTYEIELDIAGYDLETLTWYTTRRNRVVVGKNYGKTTATLTTKTKGTDVLYVTVDGETVASTTIVVK